METRRLGRTGHLSSIVTFGGAALSSVSQEEADKAIELALKSGVNHIDVAPSYGDAELRLGPWIEKHRGDFFLGCKTYERTKEIASEELHRSLERLRVDYFDLYQLHAVNDVNELDKAMEPGGAMEAVLEAREKGLVRYIGITGHGLQAPATHIEALNRFDFDTVLFALNYILAGNQDYQRDYQALLKLAKEKDVGVIVIKAIAKEPWGDNERAYNTWYRPFDDSDNIARCLSFVLSQDITTLASAGDVHLIPKILDAAQRVETLTESQQKELIATAANYQPIFQ